MKNTKKSTVIRIISGFLIVALWAGLYLCVFKYEKQKEINEAGILLLSETYIKLIGLKLNFLFWAMSVPVAAISYAIWEMPQDLSIRND